MTETLGLRDDAHAFEVYLANVRRQVFQGLQRLLAGIDHVAEVKQCMQARMVGLTQQLGDFIALEFFVLLEIEIQVVEVSLLGEVQQVAADSVHDLRQRAFIARVHTDVAGTDGFGHGDRRINVLLERTADFQMHFKRQLPGLVSEGVQLRGVHLRKTVVLAVEHMQAQAFELMTVGEIEQVEGRQAPVGEVGQ
ncbi:hypothetical protein D3C77_492760 [compost metagenome]